MAASDVTLCLMVMTILMVTPCSRWRRLVVPQDWTSTTISAASAGDMPCVSCFHVSSASSWLLAALQDEAVTVSSTWGLSTGGSTQQSSALASAWLICGAGLCLALGAQENCAQASQQVRKEGATPGSSSTGLLVKPAGHENEAHVLQQTASVDCVPETVAPGLRVPALHLWPSWAQVNVVGGCQIGGGTKGVGDGGGGKKLRKVPAVTLVKVIA